MNTKTLNPRSSLFAASALNRLLFAGACFSLAAMASAQTTPSDTEDTTLKLSVFEVTTNKDVGYRAANSVSATKVDTAIKDLPFSVSAFTSQFIKDTNSVDLFDVVRYSAGVTNGSREFNAGASGYMIRGFQQYPQHDGFFSGNQADIYVDTATIERVEVVKGPASLLYGQIQPGGTVNYITKRAEPNRFENFTAQYGSYNFARATADINQPIIGDKLLFRFNGAWEDGYQYLKNQKTRQWVIDPTATWNITKNLQLKLNYSWFQKKETPPGIYQPNIDIGTPAAITAGFAAPFPSTTTAAMTNNKNLLGVPNLGPVSGVAGTTAFAPTVDVGFLAAYPALPRKFNTASLSDYRNTNLESVNGELDSKLGEHWVARANYVYAWNRSVQQTTGIGTVALAPPGSLQFNTTGANAGKWTTTAAWTALTPTQQATADYVFAQQILANPNAAMQTQVNDLGQAVGAPAVISRRSRWIETYGHEDTVAGDLAGKYDFSWGKIKPVFGIYYDAQSQYTKTRASTGTATAPFGRTWDVDPTSPTYYVNQADYISPATVIAEGIQLSSSTSLSFTTDAAVYGLLNASFLNDRLQFTGGLRYNRSSEATVNLVPPAPPLNTPQVQSPGEKRHS